MQLLAQVACLVAAVLLAGGALSASFRPVSQGRSSLPRYLFALTAWLPLGVFTVWSVAGLTVSLPGWFWWVLGAGVVALLLHFVARRLPLLAVVRLLGTLLVIVALFSLNIHLIWQFASLLGMVAFAAILSKRQSRVSVGSSASVERRRPRHPSRWLATVFAAALVVLVALVASGVLGTSDGHTSAQAAQPSASASASPSASAASCTGDVWKMTAVTPKNGKWVVNGVPEIQEAKTPAQAKIAAQVWVDKVKATPGTLAAAAAYMLGETVDPSTLSHNGCASDAAVKLVGVLRQTVAKSDITPDQAPANGYNSGTSNGVVLASSTAGVDGNRAAIKIVTQSGTTVWVMARCGNAVTQGPPPVPPSTPPTTPSTTTPPSQCTLTAPPGYKVVNCQLVKTSCVDPNGQACGPNPPFQTPSAPPSTPPSSKPAPLPSGPSGTQAPPTPNPSGYNPGPNGAPGGGASSGGGTTVKPPKPDPTPSCSVSCGSGTQTTSPPQPS